MLQQRICQGKMGLKVVHNSNKVSSDILEELHHPSISKMVGHLVLQEFLGSFTNHQLTVGVDVGWQLVLHIFQFLV